MDPISLVGLPLYPGHGPENIGQYPGHMTRDTAAMISRVIRPGYLPISLGHVANHQTCRLIPTNNPIMTPFITYLGATRVQLLHVGSILRMSWGMASIAKSSNKGAMEPSLGAWVV